MAEYGIPDRVKTKLRCQFGWQLKDVRYGRCRNIGKYPLSGKRYCVEHHYLAWRIENPEFGQQHSWKESAPPVCERCGSIRVHEGLPQKPCKGKFAKIVLW